MPVGNSSTGSYVGTGSAINLQLGFTPDYFRVINVTDGTAGAEWFKGTPAVTIGLGTALTKVTANGVSVLTPAAGVAAGLVMGTTLSTTGKTFEYVAHRNIE
jgi:hypothetical protein